MKVISLLQPWATLVVIGEKKIETRSWNTKFRGPVLIHACKRFGDDLKEIASSGVFADVLKKHGFLKMRSFSGFFTECEFNLPKGEIIGMVDICATERTESIIECKNAGIPLRRNDKYNDTEWEKEIAFGDYSAGRHAWMLKNPVAFKVKTKTKGSLGLWEYKEPICLICGSGSDCLCGK